MTWPPLLFVCLAASTLRVFRVDLVQITYNHVSRMLFNSDDFSSNFTSRIFLVFLSVGFLFLPRYSSLPETYSNQCVVRSETCLYNMVEVSVSIQVGLNCKYREVLSTCEGFFLKEENRNVSRQTDRQL